MATPDELLAALAAPTTTGVLPPQAPRDESIAHKLLELAPLLASAGGSPAYRASVLEGYHRARRERQVLDLQRQRAALAQAADARTALYQRAQFANMQADNARATQQLDLQRQRDEQARMGHFRIEAEHLGERIADTPGIDPLEAQNQLASQLVGLSGAYHVPPNAMQSTLPNMTVQVSERKKRRARALYADAEKRYGVRDDKGRIDPGWEHSVSLQSEEFGDPQAGGAVKPAALRAIFEAPAFSVDTGTPAVPATPPTPVVRGTQAERAAELLAKRDAAKAAGDEDAAAKFQTLYTELITARGDLRSAGAPARPPRPSPARDIATARRRAYQAILTGADTTEAVRDFARLGLDPQTELGEQARQVDAAVRAYERTMPKEFDEFDLTNPDTHAKRIARARQHLAATVQRGRTGATVTQPQAKSMTRAELKAVASRLGISEADAEQQAQARGLSVVP